MQSAVSWRFAAAEGLAGSIVAADLGFRDSDGRPSTLP